MREVLGEKDVPECRWVSAVSATGRKYMEMRWEVPAAQPQVRIPLSPVSVGLAA